MNDVKQALKLYYKEGISIRKVAVATGIPRSTVSDYVKRIASSWLSPNEALDLSLTDLKDKLVPNKIRTPASVNANINSPTKLRLFSPT